MDTLSHGLRGGVAFGRGSSKKYRSSVGRGVFPDLASFGIYTASTILGLAQRADFSKHDASQIPQYVHTLYNITHSIPIRGVSFLAARAIFRKPQRVMGAWLFHILLDIPTHSAQFFPTPFLRPLSNFHIDGTPRSTGRVFITNRSLLAITYALWRANKRYGLFKRNK